MVAFGRDLQMTLENVVGGTNLSSKDRGLDASKFSIIQDLVDGDKIKEATQLAKDLSGLSLDCVDKSKQMMAAMESGIDALVSLQNWTMRKRISRTTSSTPQIFLDKTKHISRHSSFVNHTMLIQQIHVSLPCASIYYTRTTLKAGCHRTFCRKHDCQIHTKRQQRGRSRTPRRSGLRKRPHGFG